MASIHTTESLQRELQQADLQLGDTQAMLINRENELFVAVTKLRQLHQDNMLLKQQLEKVNKENAALRQQIPALSVQNKQLFFSSASVVSVSMAVVASPKQLASPLEQRLQEALQKAQYERDLALQEREKEKQVNERNQVQIAELWKNLRSALDAQVGLEQRVKDLTSSPFAGLAAAVESLKKRNKQLKDVSKRYALKQKELEAEIKNLKNKQGAGIFSSAAEAAAAADISR